MEGTKVQVPATATETAPVPTQAPTKKPANDRPTPGRRLMFTVELKRGETTIVSWKKLIRESGSGNGEPSALITNTLVSDSRPITGAHPGEDDLKHTLQPPNCFSAVIEKIERLYMGKESSEEEELDVPDDDQYDTEDSFIDDTELDEYFQVDKLSTKHNGYFVNRGKLEWIEPNSLPNLTPKKRRRKDSTKPLSATDHEPVRNEYGTLGINMKIKAAARNATLMSKKLLPAEVMASFDDHCQEGKLKAKPNVFSDAHKKLTADFPINSDNTSSARIPNKDNLPRMPETKAFDKRKSHSSKDLYKASMSSESFCPTNLTFCEKTNAPQTEPHLKRALNSNNEVEVSTKIHRKDKHTLGGYPHRSSMTLYPTQAQCSLPNRFKEGTIRPKGTTIERAIRDLEKIVELSRPPKPGNPEDDPSAQNIKRRLPQEIKQKLAKVARLSANQSKISEEELLNRLMGFLGHLVQRKTLKRNMREMVELGLSAKQQKADKFLQIKKEVLEMIKARASLLLLKDPDKQDGLTDDFQDVGRTDEKRSLKGTYCMDIALEDKICDLYDLHLEGMDEDKGPQSRKLYVEVAELWPVGYMDNFGIKDAIYRAKKRRRHNKACDKEKIEGKNTAITMKPEEPNIYKQPQNGQGRVLTDHLVQVPIPQARQISNPCLPTQGNNSAGASTTAVDAKKRLKRKSEADADAHAHVQKMQIQLGLEKNKSSRLPDESKSILQLPKPSQKPATPTSDKPA